MEFSVAMSLYTVLAFLGFVSICSWAFSEGRRKPFAEAALVPFTDPEEEAQRRKAMILWR